MLKYIRERDSQGFQRISSCLIYRVPPKPVLKLFPLCDVLPRAWWETTGFEEEGDVLESFMISDDLSNLSGVFFLCKVGLSASQFCHEDSS